MEDDRPTASPPAPPQPGRSRTSARRLLVVGLVSLALLAAVFAVPIPVFYAYLPGPVRDVERLIEVSDTSTYSSEGRLFLTTVSVDTSVTTAELVAAVFDSQATLVMKEDVTGGASLQRLQKVQRREMQDSQQHAREVALTALGHGEPSGDGARVVGTVADSAARGVLREGDVIVSTEGRKVATTCDVGSVVDTREPGDVIEVTLERDGRRRTVDITAGENPQSPGSAFLGVAMEDVNYAFEPDIKVTFETGRIAGPSAGLMFSLGLYDRLTPGDLTDGRRVAGTGTIDCDGGVGPIGGVEQKVAAAEREGADAFLAPVLNVEAARSAADDIEIVPVATFGDALEHLQGERQT